MASLWEASSTYRAILDTGYAKGYAEGRLFEARRVFLMLGEDSLGTPDAPTRTAIDAIEDVERLEQLIKQTRRAGSWQELLGQPAPRRRNGRRKSGP